MRTEAWARGRATPGSGRAAVCFGGAHRPGYRRDPGGVRARVHLALATRKFFPNEIADHGLAVLNLVAEDHLLDLPGGKPAGLDALVLHGLSFAGCEAGGEKYSHLLGNVP